MFQQKRIGRFLAMFLVAFTIAAQVMFVGTAAFAEDREKVSEEECNVVSVKEDQTYRQENLARIARDYQVDAEYLAYIASVEETFHLEPYELFALIAQESKYVPATNMDGGSLSYNTTQMKLATAKTAYMAITEYYHKEIPYPNGELLSTDKYYATYLAGGYLRYLEDVYMNKYESYTAYRLGINGRLTFYENNGHYKSAYAVQVESLSRSFAQ
ncbi:hypothetical protein UNSWDHB_2183 [Dehalobacter sp. UNSWDHB]|uniref:hypothetical protein n=1 Tax=unclassified Dehalobacter TaxID=2635733 RepID=UPI00028AD179|nr:MULTISPECIES: hypothetical protein [unclassified Dehalobacter]AFV01217.1 hypothetical protein DHBDCA_p189 [Dehalobacter sp. DCA]AFV04257.1 hypothetical protein DCF50_p251 [Dehalobacter sp. CF]EQB20502.1 hypothetical protein UNSWDHB_2183 [Dehalobacter sp. UNSWDHB]